MLFGFPWRVGNLAATDAIRLLRKVVVRRYEELANEAHFGTALAMHLPSVPLGR